MTLELCIEGLDEFEANIEQATEMIEHLAQAADGITQPVTINNHYQCALEDCKREGNSEPKAAA